MQSEVTNSNGQHKPLAQSRPREVKDNIAYGVAIGSVIVAALIRWMLDPVLGDRAPFFLFLLAVVAASYFGALRHTVLAAVLGGVVGWYFFVPYRYSFRAAESADSVGIIAYTLIVGTISILSERLRSASYAEYLAHQHAQRLDATLLSIADAVIATDATGHITSMNPTAELLTAWNSAGCMGASIDEVFRIINDQTEKPVESPVQKVLTSGRMVEFADHTVLIARDGTRRHIEDSAAPILDPDGNVDGVVLVFRDITGPRQAEIMNRRLAAIVESSEDAIISKDLDGTILSWNQGAEHMFGYTADEVIGKSILMLFPEDRVQEEPSILQRVANGERVEHYETVRRRKDGTIIHVSLTISPIRDGTGRVIGASKIARDITERVHAETEREHLLESERAARTEAERSARLRDEFLAVVSHELRTPLNGVLGWAQLLKRTQDPESLNEGIHAIESGARAQAQLINDLLDMNRIMNGKLHLDIQSAHLPAVIESALATIRPAAEAKGIRLQTTLATNIAPIRGDPTRLQQVFWNLISNAVKFTPRGGTIQVLLERINSHIEISVADDGVGIKPEFLPHVFERFRQADTGVSRRYGGLGLGLAIVKQIVELHGGSVAVDSEGEGKGTTFHVRLPVSIVRRPADLEPEYVSAAAAGINVDLSGISVLIVDDDPGAADVVRRLLATCKAEAIVATSGADALERIQESSPDLILSDIGMPGMDGYEFIQAVRATGNTSPAIAITAFARPEDRIHTLRAGYSMHLSKPIDARELLTMVEALLRDMGRFVM